MSERPEGFVARRPIEEMVQGIFEKRKVLIKGHFVMSCGDHTGDYVDKDNLLSYPHEWQQLMAHLGMLAIVHMDSPPDFVCGPLTGGAFVAQSVAEFLSRTMLENTTRFALVTEKDGVWKFRGNISEELAGKTVLYADDVLSTGKTLCQTIKLGESLGARTVGAIGLFNRGEVTSKMLGAPWLECLFSRKFDQWSPGKVPDWLEEIPVSKKYGHG